MACLQLDLSYSVGARQAAALPQATGTVIAKEVLAGKRALRALVAETLEEFNDVGKGNIFAVAEKLAKQLAALHEAEPENPDRTLIDERVALVKGLAAKLVSFDMAAMNTDNFKQLSAELESMIVAFDSSWENFKAGIEEMTRVLAVKKKEP
jgi:hypothetical protein